MELYSLLASRIEASRDEVTRSADAHSQRAHAAGATEGSSCVWRGDTALAEVIANIKNMCLVLSSDFTKLVLIAPNAPSANELGSLLGEIIPHVEAFSVYFTCSFVGLQSVSSHLFRLVTVPIRALLSNLVDLTNLLKNSKWDAARKAVGAIIDLCEHSIDRQLPATNKVAYRRAVMDKATKAAEIHEEFCGYVQKSVAFLENTSSNTSSSGNNGNSTAAHAEDMEESDDDEGTYTSEELVVMQSHCELLSACVATMKLVLSCVTEAGDAVHPLVGGASQNAAQNAASAAVARSTVDGGNGGGAGTAQAQAHSVTQANATAASVFEPAVSEGITTTTTTAAAGTSGSTPQHIQTCRYWAYDMVRLCELLDASLVDYGADLYSPLEDEQSACLSFCCVCDFLSSASRTHSH